MRVCRSVFYFAFFNKRTGDNLKNLREFEFYKRRMVRLEISIDVKYEIKIDLKAARSSSDRRIDNYTLGEGERES